MSLTIHVEGSQGSPTRPPEFEVETKHGLDGEVDRLQRDYIRE